MHNPSMNELRLLRAARAGDTKAQRELETQDLLREASSHAEKLRNRAVGGDAAALVSLRRLASGHRHIGTKPSQAASVRSAGDTKTKISAARADERERIRRVFAAEASKGRERLCASILTASEGYTAEEIIAKLPDLATDNQIAAQVQTDKTELTSAVWERARAKTQNGAKAEQPRASENTSPDPTPSDPWSKAYAKAQRNDRRAA